MRIYICLSKAVLGFLVREASVLYLAKSCVLELPPPIKTDKLPMLCLHAQPLDSHLGRYRTKYQLCLLTDLGLLCY